MLTSLHLHEKQGGLYQTWVTFSLACIHGLLCVQFVQITAKVQTTERSRLKRQLLYFVLQSEFDL